MPFLIKNRSSAVVSMSRSISKCYESAIGQNYVVDTHTNSMAQNHDTTIWDRIVEAVESIEIKANPTSVGRLIDISQPAVRQWELGETTPSAANLREIAKKTGFYTRYLEDGKGPKKPGPITKDDEELTELIQIWPSLNPKVRTRLLTIAQENNAKGSPPADTVGTRGPRPKSN
jgi:transcriptional regulator with XRE-family HTH domain